MSNKPPFGGHADPQGFSQPPWGKAPNQLTDRGWPNTGNPPGIPQPQPPYAVPAGGAVVPPHLQQVGGSASHHPAPIQIIPPAAGLFDLLVPNAYTVFNRTTRRKGDASLYNLSLSPSRPYQFPLGTFELPKNMALFLTDIQVRAATFSGVGATDTVWVDEGNLTTQVGIDFEIGSRRPMDTKTEITPPPILPPSAFQTVAANATSNPSGGGTALLPLAEGRPGTEDGPLSFLVQASDGLLQVRLYVFRPLSLPIAFFQLKLAGYQTNRATAEQVMVQLRSG
jgi:hypothetical protein